MSRLLDDDELAEAWTDLTLAAAMMRHETESPERAVRNMRRHIDALTAELECEKAEGDRLAAAVTAAVTSYRGVVQRG